MPGRRPLFSRLREKKQFDTSKSVAQKMTLFPKIGMSNWGSVNFTSKTPKIFSSVLIDEKFKKFLKNFKNSQCQLHLTQHDTLPDSGSFFKHPATSVQLRIFENKVFKKIIENFWKFSKIIN